MPFRCRRCKKLKYYILFITILILVYSCGQQNAQSDADSEPIIQNGEKSLIVTGELELDFSKYNVTFIELGAENCIPCKAMKPVMQEIAEEYKGKIQVVFYDVRKDPRPSRKYGIRLIPTQVFIDSKGNEIFRHVGFFSKEDIVNMLKEKGVI